MMALLIDDVAQFKRRMLAADAATLVLAPRSGGTKGAGEAGGLASVRHGLETRDNRGPRQAENDEIAGFERTPDVEHVANLGVLQWL